jgi:hypothetical protein
MKTPRLIIPNYYIMLKRLATSAQCVVNGEWKDIDLALMCLSTHCNRVRTESVEGSLLSAAVFVR